MSKPINLADWKCTQTRMYYTQLRPQRPFSLAVQKVSARCYTQSVPGLETFGIFQNMNPLVWDFLYPKYHIFNTYTQRTGNKKTVYMFYKICWVLNKDVNTCTQSRCPVVSRAKHCALGLLESIRRTETTGACCIINVSCEKAKLFAIIDVLFR